MKALIIALGLILASSSLLLAQYPPIPSPTDPDGADDVFGTGDDGLQPASSGQLKNAGNITLNSVAVDLLGNSRVGEGEIDVGAYEN